MGNSVEVSTNVNAVVFNGLLHGFLPSMSTVYEWAKLAKNAEVDGWDDDCEENDPKPTWFNGDISYKKYLIEYKKNVFDDEIEFMEEKVQRIIKNLNVFINAIVRENPNGTYIVFGRDCWPLSMLMKMRGIDHYYIEGASRNVIRNQAFWNIIYNLPCTRDCVLIDTGYAGSVPCGYIRAHGIDPSLFAHHYTIKLMCADIERYERQATWLPVDYDHCDAICDKRMSFCEDIEMLPKFYSRPITCDEEGYPILRVCRTADKAFGYYLMMLDYIEKHIDNSIRIAA